MEVQALNTLIQTLQGSIVLQSIAVTFVLAFIVIQNGRSRAKQDERDSKAEERNQGLIGELFATNKKALDTKEQLDKLHDLREGEMAILENQGKALAVFPNLIGDIETAIQALHETTQRISALTLDGNQALVNFLTAYEHESEKVQTNIRTIDQKVDTMMDSNARLVILLERLNVNLETFNSNMARFNEGMEVIKQAVLKEVTSETSAVIVDPPAESSSDKPEPGA